LKGEGDDEAENAKCLTPKKSYIRSFHSYNIFYNTGKHIDAVRMFHSNMRYRFTNVKPKKTKRYMFIIGVCDHEEYV